MSGEALSRLVAGSGLGWLLLDGEDRIVETGGGLEGLLGLEAGGLAGRALYDALPCLADHRRILDRAGERPARLRLTLPGGRHLRLRVLSLEGVRGLLVEDISLPIRRSEALSRRIRELETRCRQLERRLIAQGSSAEGDYDAEHGLYTETAFIERLVAEEGFTRRWHSPLSVLVVRLPEGEPALGAAADALRAVLRAGDLAGRVAGGRIALLLPQTDSAGAARVAERLRALPALAGATLGTATLREGGTALETYQQALAAAT